MTITAEEKAKIIQKFALTEGDTGSPEVQIALLSARIENLSEHLKDHRKDNHSRRGLLQMVGQRRRLVQYLKSTDEKRYEKLAKELKL